MCVCVREREREREREMNGHALGVNRRVVNEHAGRRVPVLLLLVDLLVVELVEMPTLMRFSPPSSDDSL